MKLLHTLAIPFNQKAYELALKDYADRGSYMIIKFADCNRDILNATRLRGFITERHCTEYIKFIFPKLYKDPMERPATNGCSHDFKLVFNKIIAYIDIASIDKNGNFKFDKNYKNKTNLTLEERKEINKYNFKTCNDYRKEQWLVDLHILAKPLNSGYWNDTDYSKGFGIVGCVSATKYLNGDVKIEDIMPFQKFIDFINKCIKDNL